MNFCTKCGTKFNDDSHICKNCDILELDEEVLKKSDYQKICNFLTLIYHKKKIVSFECLEKLFIRFTEELFMKKFQLSNKPIVNVVDSDIFEGSYDGYITIYLNRRLIDNFQKGYPLQLFEMISHELHHIQQNREYKHVNIKKSMIEKDEYLNNNVPNYYNENYSILSNEVDAFLNQQSYALNILNQLCIKPSIEEMNISISNQKKILKYLYFAGRIFNNDIYQLDDIFEEVINQKLKDMEDYAKVNFLEVHPCINIEYKIDNSCLVKRNIKEIENIYQEWKDGKIILEGSTTEIDDYFHYLKNKLKNTKRK